MKYAFELPRLKPIEEVKQEFTEAYVNQVHPELIDRLEGLSHFECALDLLNQTDGLTREGHNFIDCFAVYYAKYVAQQTLITFMDGDND